MKLVALCGAAGAGKDTVADMLPARKLSWSDALYTEVAEAFSVTVESLQARVWKEVEQAHLALEFCRDPGFLWAMGVSGVKAGDPDGVQPRSPRQILQWWGTEYRRAQSENYWIDRCRDAVLSADDPVVLCGMRFPNEAAMVRQLGGQIWQIKRPGYEAGGTGHASDTAGGEFGPDRVVVNDGTRTQLHSRVLDLWADVTR